MHVLILGARAPACLEWARAFHASGWQVSVGDSLSWPLSRASRACDHYLRLPEPRHDVGAWIAALAQAIREHGITLLLPTCEEAFYLAHGKHKLPTSCRVICSDLPLMQGLHHKGQFAALTAGWAVSAPETVLLEQPHAAQAFAAQSQLWVFKPAYSRFASQTLLRPPASQLHRVTASTDEPWVAQRFVSGREYCSFSLLDQGRVSAHACYQPRHRVGRGSGIWFDPADPAPLREFVQQFGRATGYSGQVGFDFIEDRDGRFHVLECNPRATSGVHLFAGQPQALVRALCEAGTTMLIPETQPQMVALAMLLFAAPRLLLPGGPAMTDFRHDYARARDVVARHGDHGPLLAQLPGLAEIVARALRRRCSLLAAATADIEWNGQPLPALP